MSMSRNEMNEAIEKFLAEGGEVTHLKYANKKMQEKGVIRVSVVEIYV